MEYFIIQLSMESPVNLQGIMQCRLCNTYYTLQVAQQNYNVSFIINKA